MSTNPWSGDPRSTREKRPKRIRSLLSPDLADSTPPHHRVDAQNAHLSLLQRETICLAMDHSSTTAVVSLRSETAPASERGA